MTPPATRPRPLKDGIYAPTMTFFQADSEDLDVDSIRQHAVVLARSGLKGLVTMGSNGEAVHLNHVERSSVTLQTRLALDAAGFKDMPVIVGASEHSVRGTLELCELARQAGGDYVLLVPPSYYRTAMDEARVVEYFTVVADQSPLPIILYNYPGGVAGIDMDSDLIISLSQHHNIIGTKFTCGSTGKLARVALAMDAATIGHRGSGYMAFGGIADFTAQTLASRGSAVIAGGANVFPKVVVRVWDLWAEGKIVEAIELQRKLSKGDWILTKSGIPGTKRALEAHYGYGGIPRKPLRTLSDVEATDIVSGIDQIMEIEKSLPGKVPAAAAKQIE